VFHCHTISLSHCRTVALFPAFWCAPCVDCMWGPCGMQLLDCRGRPPGAALGLGAPSTLTLNLRPPLPLLLCGMQLLDCRGKASGCSGGGPRMPLTSGRPSICRTRGNCPTPAERAPRPRRCAARSDTPPSTHPTFPLYTPHFPLCRPHLPLCRPHFPLCRPHFPPCRPHFPLCRPHFPLCRPHFPRVQTLTDPSTVQSPTDPSAGPTFPSADEGYARL